MSYAENKSYKRYSSYEVLDISPQDVITAADYAWKQVAVAVTISGLEEMQNSGRSAFIKLVDSRVTVAEASMMNGLSADLYSDGMADSGKQITGLQAAVSATPSTGTYGSIPAANYRFLAQSVRDGRLHPRTPSCRPWTAMYAELVRNQDKPDLIPCDSAKCGHFILVGASRPAAILEHGNVADAGFTNIMFFQAPVVLDGGLGGSAPAGHMYFLNCKHISWRPHTQAQHGPPWRRSHVDQSRRDGKADRLYGEPLTTSNRSLQGLLVDSSP